MNVAILKLADVVTSSKLGKQAEKNLQAALQALKQDVANKRRQAVEAEGKARQAARGGAAEVQQESARLRREAEYAEREAQIRAEEQRRTLLDDVLQRVHPLIAELAREQDVDLVLLAPNPAIAYFNPRLDLTGELVRRIDAAGDPASHSAKG